MPRRKHDFYETPPHYIDALLSRVHIVGDIFEPCVGTGCISKRIDTSQRNVYTNDIDKRRKADWHFDAAEVEGWEEHVSETLVDWVITNPPFNRWLDIARIAVMRTPNVALLARLSILEPTEDREVFWTLHPPTGLIVLPRYSFRLNDAGKRQTDSVTCCWVIWEDGQQPCLSVEGRPS